MTMKMSNHKLHIVKKSMLKHFKNENNNDASNTSKMTWSISIIFKLLGHFDVSY